MDLSKLKLFADNKIKVNEKLNFTLVRVENIVAKEDTSTFSLFPRWTKSFLEAYKYMNVFIALEAIFIQILASGGG